ncbi:MAG: response regulator transcription factor [Vulcanimicrobiaceae bacterium]
MSTGPVAMEQILVGYSHDFLRKRLQDAGYLVMSADTSDSILRTVLRYRPQLIVLDDNCPQGEQAQTCRVLRAEVEAPIIVLVRQMAAPQGGAALFFEFGADDYMLKPFGFSEFLARLKAQLRRYGWTETDPGTGFYKLGNLALEARRNHLLVDEKPFRLTPRESQLLRFFMQHPDRVIAFTEIMEHVWPKHVETSFHTLNVHIHWLRAKIELDRRSPKRLVTLRGRGYMLRTKPALSAS